MNAQHYLTRKNLTVAVAIVLTSFMFMLLPGVSLAAAPGLTALETVANHATVNDQTDVTTTPIANVAEVKATLTVGVVALPGTSETATIGSCVVTFTTVASSTVDEVNCNDNVASIDRTLSTGDTLRTTTQIATALQSITNASSTGTHGALTVTAGGSATTTVFTTTGAETSATAITFTDGTAGDLVSVSSTNGVVAVAQRNVITIGGTVEAGDIFTVTLPTVGAVTYTVTSATTTTQVTAGVLAAILASSGYSSQAFTAATSSATTIALNAKVAGTGFIQTSGTTNVAATAQVVTFTPADVTNGDELTITINSVNYTFELSADGVQHAVGGLNSELSAASEVACTEDDLKVTCTAAVAGTSFTYAASATEGSSSSGSHGGGRRPVTTPVKTTVSPVVNNIPNTTSYHALANFIFRTALHQGMTSEDVRQLQIKLAADGVFTGPISGYFGPLTMAAVKSFQTKHSIPSIGVVGPMTLAELNAGVSVPVPVMSIAERDAKIVELLKMILDLKKQLADQQ